MITDNRVRWFVRIFLLSGFMLCLDGFWQLTTGFDIFKHLPLTEGRMSASFHHPNGFGAYLIVLIAIALYQTQRLFDLSRKAKTAAGYLSVTLMSILTTVFFLSIGLSMSRGALIGMFAGLMFLAMVDRRTRWLVFTCGFIFLIIFIPKIVQERNYTVFPTTVSPLASPSLTPSTLPLGSSPDSSLSSPPVSQAVSVDVASTSIWQGTGRETFWSDALKIIRDNPLIGTGLNTYTQAIKHYVPFWQNYPHNCYLQMAAEIGIIGVVFFLWFVLSLIGLVLDSLKKNREDQFRGLLTAFAASFVGLLVESTLDTTLYSSQLDALFWLMAGLCMVYSLANMKPVFAEGQ
jgi:O-antigen ligase